MARGPDLVALQEVTLDSASVWRGGLARDGLSFLIDSSDLLSASTGTHEFRRRYFNLIGSRWPVVALDGLQEGEFPADVSVYDFEFKPGWKIEFKKDDKGKIVGAVWTGVMMPYEFVEFGILGLNSKTGTSLVWKFVQYHDDGSKEEFTGPPGSRLPSPVTTLSASKSARLSSSTPDHVWLAEDSPRGR